MGGTFIKGVLAGMLIGTGGYAYLSVGGVAGSVLFSFGLVAVLLYSLKLYTGCAGSHEYSIPGDLGAIAVVLLANITGCAIVSAIVGYGADGSGTVVAHRMSSTMFELVGRSFMCGFVMDMCVHAYKSSAEKGVGAIVPALLGVPLFILSGFYHSVADSFYFSSALFGGQVEPTVRLIGVYGVEVAGNFVGCNVRRVADLLLRKC